MKLIRFEFKKMIRQKKILLLFLIVLLSVISIFIRNIYMQDQLVNSHFEDLLPHVQETEKTRADFERTFKDRENEERYMAAYENMSVWISTIRAWEEAIRNNDWVAIPELELKYFETVNAHIEYGGQYDTLSEQEIEQRIKKSEILLNHNLPIEDDRYSIAAPNFMKTATELFLSLWGILLLVFIFGGQLTDEYDHHTIRTLHTQPISKESILINKFFSMMFGVILTLLFLVIVSYTIPLAFGNTGSLAYPQLILFQDNYIFISISEYMFKLLMIFIGVAAFTLSLLLLVSLIVRIKYISIFLTIGILSGGSFITSQNDVLQSLWNPFYYVGLNEIIERPEQHWNLIYTVIPFAYAGVILLIASVAQNWRKTLKQETPTLKPFNNGYTIKDKNSFTGIWLFELRKTIRRGTIKQIIWVSVIFIIIGYGYLSFQTYQKNQSFVIQTTKYINHLENEGIPQQKMLLKEQETIVNEFDNREEPLSQKEEVLKIQAQELSKAHRDWLSDNEDYLHRYKSLLEAYKKHDWNIVYDHFIDMNLHQSGRISIDRFNFIDNRETERIGLSDFTYVASITEKEILKERSIEPVFSLELLYTIYDKYISPVDQIKWRSETLKMDNTGLFYLYLFFQSYVYLLPLGLILFEFGLGYTTERGKKRNIDFLYTQPVSKYQLFIGKAGISSGLSILFILGIILFIVLIGTIGNGFGNWNYPILHYGTSNGLSNYEAKEGAFYFIDMGNYLIKSSLLLLSATIFLITLSNAVSIFFKNPMSNFICTLVLAIGGYFVSTVPMFTSISHLLPFTYLDIGRVVNGELAVLLQNETIHTAMGVVPLFIGTLVIFSVSTLLTSFFGCAGRSRKGEM